MAIQYLLFVTCLLCGTCIAAPGYVSLDDQWQEWKTVYSKVYSSPGEELERRRIWEENLDFIEAHNNRISATYQLAMNEFGDQRVSKRKTFNARVSTPGNVFSEDNMLTFSPSHFDWRSKGVITAVKNQGILADSESRVVAECVESYHAIKTSKLVGLSVLEVEQCCSTRGPQEVLPIVEDCFGCVHDLGGLCGPGAYHSPQGKCSNGSCTALAQVQGTKTITPGKEDEMARVLREVEPLMVYVDASHISFQLYKSGVYEEANCKTHQLDHTLQLVGYGVMDDKLYWICKNSWGENWGNRGYIWIRRGTNECGIASNVKYPF